MFQFNFQHGYYVCHRLDFATSGLLVIPLTKRSAKAACKAFESKLVTKIYLAIVRGHCAQDKYHVKVPIGNDSRPEYSSIKMATSDSEFVSNPRNAETLIKVVSRGTYQGSPATKILLRPLTGRRHQLRLHCHHIGHTIVGDFTYSNRLDTSPLRMYLHALKISLPNPVENLEIITEDPFVQDYEETQIVIRDLFKETFE